MLSYQNIYFGSQCNNRCADCFVSDDRESRSLNELVAQLDALSDRENIALSGGEPTLHEDLLSVVSYARRRGAKRIKLETNGRYLANRELVESLVAQGCRVFEVSLFGARPDTHEGVTGTRGSFHETLGGLENLRVFSAMDDPTKQIYVIARIGVTAHNLDDVLPIVSLVTSFGIDVLRFVRMGSRFGMLQGAQVVANAMKVATLNRIWSFCEGFPPCTMKGSETHLSELLRPVQASGEKPKSCAKCVFSNVCPGPPKDYAKAQGIAEFHAVSTFRHLRGLEYLLGVNSSDAAE